MNYLNPFILLLTIILIPAAPVQDLELQGDLEKEVREHLRDEVLQQAAWALEQEPVTVTAAVSERSAGGKNDFYSEGDYWWPDPEDPEGAYIRRDGQTNPDNFVAHREAMIRFSQIMGALVSAYELTGDAIYADHATRHLKAWFINQETRMNPSLNYAQAIKGRVTGRGIGIIDTLHLVEVAQATRILEKDGVLDAQIAEGVKSWFTQYLHWLTTHPYGIEEMNWKNNHSTAWTLQVASFARLTGDEKLLELCRNRYKQVLLPNQMAPDGSFPLELERTKPYGYSLFNLDVMTALVHLLSDDQHNLWNYSASEGESIEKGIQFLFPYVRNKDKWPYAQDVMYWEEWPIAHSFLLFGAKAFDEPEWLQVWKTLEHQPQEAEVLRNFPIRNPIIWLGKGR